MENLLALFCIEFTAASALPRVSALSSFWCILSRFILFKLSQYTIEYTKCMVYRGASIQIMAYYNIAKRPTADGSVRYRCTVGVKSGGKHLHRESKTFGKLTQAKTWGMRRENELDENDIPNPGKVENLTVGDLIKNILMIPGWAENPGALNLMYYPCCLTVISHENHYVL